MNESAEEAAGRLYGLPLEEFTSARNAAVKELREQGLPADADAVKALAKPTVAAWAVNQLTRRRHADLDEFLEAAVAAREAQLGGGGDARAEIKRQREALAKLVRAAREELGGDAGEGARARLREAEDEHRAAVAEERQAHKRWQQAVGETEQAAERVEQS